jgi:hypothetical protein
MHDYIALCENWYENVEPYLKEDFKVAITEVLDSKGNRFIDWILHPLNYRITDFVTFPNRYLLPYSEQKLQRFQYVPGYFFVASVEFMQRYPLNENLSWGEGEDVEWSFRWRDLPDTYQLIRNARVRLLKDKTASALELKGLRLRVFRLFSCRPFFILHNRFKVDVRQVRRALGLRDKMN